MSEKVSYRVAADRVGLLAQVEYLVMEADKLEAELEAAVETLKEERASFEERAREVLEDREPIWLCAECACPRYNPSGAKFCQHCGAPAP